MKRFLLLLCVTVLASFWVLVLISCGEQPSSTEDTISGVEFKYL